MVEKHGPKDHWNLKKKIDRMENQYNLDRKMSEIQRSEQPVTEIFQNNI